ncbi:MAG: hypothetical protein QG608_110 [Actinomycetota bacterium]|nr:hypothetical protein [Actinomycetota bacterium]
MLLYLRARKTLRALAIIGAVQVVILATGATKVPFLSLADGGSVQLPAALLLPVLAAAAVAYSVAAPTSVLERVAVRPLQRLDAVLVLGYCLFLLVSGGLLWTAGVDLAAESTRNALGFVGATCLAVRFLGPGPGTTILPVYVLLSVASGGARRPRPWTWFLVQDAGPRDVTIALLLLGLGLLCWSSQERTGGSRGFPQTAV